MTLYRLLERSGFRPLARRLYDVELVGADLIPHTGAVILVANHESMFDPWVLALATPRPVRYMAKAELWRSRLVGSIMESFGAFPVERGTGDTTAISRAAQLLGEGQVIGIFPQGTSKQTIRRPFHRGAARLALTTGAPLVPVSLSGTRGLPRPWRRHHARVTVAQPIRVPPGRPTILAVKRLTAQLEQRVMESAA